MTRADGSDVVLPARAILVARARNPTRCWRVRTGASSLDGKYFQAVDADGGESDSRNARSANRRGPMC